MILIEEVDYNGQIVRYYKGIDFDVLLDHKKDGSDGFIFCFIDNWVREVKSFNRNKKINSLIEDGDYIEFDWENINNNYISIYQADGITVDLLYNSIKEKLLQNQLIDSTYLSITECDDKGIINSGGAWDISNILSKRKLPS